MKQFQNMRQKQQFFNNMPKQKGSMLVELMIGLFMSALTVLGALTIYAEFEGQKRTTAQMGQTISNGAIAMFPIQHEAKMSGYGINSKSMLGCDVLAYQKPDVGLDRNFNFVLAPVSITYSGSNSVSDKIQFMSGNADKYFSSVKLTSGVIASNPIYKVDNRFGFMPGNLIIAAQSGKQCVLSEITEIPTIAGKTDQIVRNTGSYTDPTTGDVRQVQYNPTIPLGGGFDVGAEIFNVGSIPSVNLYEIDNKQLKKTNLITNQVEIAGDNVVLLKALYGLDRDGDFSVEDWTPTLPALTDYQFLKGIRVGMVIQSPLREKGNLCNITTNSNINWFGGTMDISTLNDWRCYRYRLIQSTIPIKNLLWTN